MRRPQQELLVSLGAELSDGSDWPGEASMHPALVRAMMRDWSLLYYINAWNLTTFCEKWLGTSPPRLTDLAHQEDGGPRYERGLAYGRRLTYDRGLGHDRGWLAAESARWRRHTLRRW